MTIGNEENRAILQSFSHETRRSSLDIGLQEVERTVRRISASIPINSILNIEGKGYVKHPLSANHMGFVNWSNSSLPQPLLDPFEHIARDLKRVFRVYRLVGFARRAARQSLRIPRAYVVLI